MSGLAAIASALAPREVEVPGYVPGTSLRLAVRPPTVEEAVVVLGAGEAGDAEATAWAVRSWLPPRLAALLLSRAVAPEERGRVVADLIAAGCPERERAKQEATKEAARTLGWARALSDFAATYRLDPRPLPWPYFLTLLGQVPAVQAQEALMNARWYAGAKTGKLDDLLREAGVGAPREAPAAPEHLRGEAGKAWKEEKLARFRAARQKRAEA